MEIERLSMRKNFGALGAREEQQAVDQLRKPLSLFEARLENGSILLARSLARDRDLDLTAQIVDRRAELVGDVGGESRQLAECFFQAVEHPVAGRRELRELHRHAARIETLVERRRVNAAERFFEALDRPQTSSRDDESDRRGEEQYDGQHAQHLVAVAREQAVVIGGVDRQLQDHVRDGVRVRLESHRIEMKAPTRCSRSGRPDARRHGRPLRPRGTPTSGDPAPPWRGSPREPARTRREGARRRARWAHPAIRARPPRRASALRSPLSRITERSMRTRSTTRWLSSLRRWLVTLQ